MKKIIFGLLVGVFFSLPLQIIYAADLSKQEIIQIAIKEFENKGGRIQDRVIIYDVNNGQWERGFSALDPEMAKKFEFLQDKDYQVVLLKLKPKPGLEGSNVWVFVDRITGIALAVYRE